MDANGLAHDPASYWDSTKDASYPQIATALRQANLGWVRIEFSWGPYLAYDARKQNTDSIDWSGMDTAVTRAVCRGLNVYADIAYTPLWAVNRFNPQIYAGLSAPVARFPGRNMSISDAAKTHLLPDNMNDWAAFVRAVVTRYPQIKYWSIWNEPDATGAFLGSDPRDTSVATVANAYDSLIVYAAPWIRNNPDGQGRRYLMAPELAGTGDPVRGQPFLRKVLSDQKQNIDIVVVHSYPGLSGTATTVNYMRALAGSGDVAGAGWSGDVWLTEVGLPGCNDRINGARARYSDYCVGPFQGYIDDNAQTQHLTAIVSGMVTSPASARWTKTFYWHSHLEVFSDTVSNNSGILSGAHIGAVTSRPAYTAYAGLAGALQVTGAASYASGPVNVPVTATVAAVPTAALAEGPYYYVWTYMWCFNGNAPGDCDHQWHPYASGTMSTVSPRVYAQDYYVKMAVQVYGWQGGPRVGSGEWNITGDGTCTDPRGCGGGGAQMQSAAQAGAVDTLRVQGAAAKADPTAERRKGIGHAGNA